MICTEKYLSFNSSVLHYVKAGRGAENMLIFHGFGQDNTVFTSLVKELSDKYTLYIFDLFFHGKSMWDLDETPLEKSEWKEIMVRFLNENGIDKFSLAGFSLGGKFVLATLESFPEKTEKVILMAPDGIKTSFWYSLATYPVLFRKFFKSMIIHPQRFFKVAKLANKLGLADKGLVRFAQHQMNTEEKRKRVYYSWIVFRHLTFNMKTIAEIVNAYEIPLTMIVGKYDKVIKVAGMNRLLKGLKNYRLQTLETGHNGLIREAINAMH